MAVAIRLRREGATNAPYFRIVVSDSRERRDGRFIEQVGIYDPKQPGANFRIDLDRVNHWISKGARPSGTVASLMKKTKAIEG